MCAMMTFEQTVAFLHAHDNFLLLTHRRPDGDTLGSAGALAQGLREAGKTAYALRNPETTPRYARFIDGHIAPDGFVPECIVAVDTASAGLLPPNAAQYADNVALCIDHHPSNTLYARDTYLVAESATCGELVYALLMAAFGTISPKSADCLYTALTTDTGCFVFANTTAGTLRAAASLIDAGAAHRELNKLLFRTKKRSRIAIEGMVYSGLEFYFGGAVALSVITGEMARRAQADEDDLDDISSIPGSVDGVLVGITLRELTSPLDCKASVRTNGSVDACAICALFGGGGHPMAAGFSQDKTINEIKQELIATLGGFLPTECEK